MKLLSILFLVSLLLGQIGGIPIVPGVVVYVHDILLAVLLVEGFVQYAIRGKLVNPNLLKPILLFVFVAILSLLTNSGKFAIPSLEISALYIVRWLFYACIYIVVIQTYTGIDLWLTGLYGVGVGLGVLGLVQFFLYPDLRNLSYLGWDPHYYRLFSTFLDPNFAGVFLVLTLFLGLYLWQMRKYRMAVAIGELICFVSLLLTYSRSSYLAFITGLVCIAFLKRQWMIIVGIVVFVAVVIVLPKTSGSTLNLLRTDSTFARVGNWQEGIALLSESPLFGHGFDTLRYLSADTGDVISKSAAGLDSSILFIGATTGILGLIAYGYLLFQMVRVGRSLAKGKKFAYLGTVYVASLAALGVHSLFVNSAFYPWVLIWFWIYTGVAERVSGGT